MTTVIARPHAVMAPANNDQNEMLTRRSYTIETSRTSSTLRSSGDAAAIISIATQDTFTIFVVLDERGRSAYPAFRHVDRDQTLRIYATRLGVFDTGLVCRRLSDRRRRPLWDARSHA
jgi:hypothetical protein